jgi:hypothetical protein
MPFDVMVRVCVNKPLPGYVGSAREQELVKTQGGDIGCARPVDRHRNFAAKPQFSLLHIS